MQKTRNFANESWLPIAGTAGLTWRNLMNAGAGDGRQIQNSGRNNSPVGTNGDASVSSGTMGLLWRTTTHS
jgi:hypothetical protein